MNMVIQFSHPKPRAHLLTHGRVYTARANPVKTGKNWASSGRGKPKIADVNITFVEIIDAGNLGKLKKYVKDSGFKYPAHWITAIMNLTKSKTVDSFLYLVEVI